MTATIPVAVPRKGRPLEAVLDRLAALTGATKVADEVCLTLRYEKAITKGEVVSKKGVYDRVADYSDLTDPTRPEYTLLRDDREGKPRRVVFDSLTLDTGEIRLQLIGARSPFARFEPTSSHSDSTARISSSKRWSPSVPNRFRQSTTSPTESILATPMLGS